jgi:CheD chemotactic sensory transduction
VFGAGVEASAIDAHPDLAHKTNSTLRRVSFCSCPACSAGARFAREFLTRDGIPLLASDLGGRHGRQIHFDGSDDSVYLRKLMAERPIPVVICSTLTEQGAEETLQAMSAGAVDIITKPKLGLKGFLKESRTLLGDAIKGAARARVGRRGGRFASFDKLT